MASSKTMEGKGIITLTAQDYIALMYEIKAQNETIITNQNKILEAINKQKTAEQKESVEIKASSGELGGLVDLFVSAVAGDVKGKIKT